MKARTANLSGLVVLLVVSNVVLSSRAAYRNTLWQDAQSSVRLGEALFFEMALSTRKNTSCATCHIPEYSFTDQRQFSTGQNGKKISRNAPTLINRPAVGFQFWDGRALSLPDQVIHPLENPDEMGDSAEDACRRLKEIPKYLKMFDETFGDPNITPERVATAVAAYLQTLRHYESDYDRAKRSGSLSKSIAKGEKLFFGKARCGLCHTGQNFTDERFHNTGVDWRAGKRDAGRGALTGRQEEMRAFKTPTLRELIRTAPYMHDGSLKTLEDVIEFYDGGGSPSDPNLDKVIKPARLTRLEVKALVAFLRALSASEGPPFRQR